MNGTRRSGRHLASHVATSPALTKPRLEPRQGLCHPCTCTTQYQATASDSTDADWKQNLTIAHSKCSRQAIDSDCDCKRGSPRRFGLAYCPLSVFYLKRDSRRPKAQKLQETETAHTHTVHLATRPPQNTRETKTCNRPRKVRRPVDRGTQRRRRRKRELKRPANRNPKRPSGPDAPSYTKREPARQAGLGGGDWWTQTCRAHVTLTRRDARSNVRF